MKRILCIDGGGMRGYLPAVMLAAFERQFGPVSEHFHLISGTSIGGILAGLLACGVKAQDALAFFTEDGPKIFHREWWRYFGALNPRYGADKIEDALQRRFAGLTPKIPYLIPSLDLTTQAPYFFKLNDGVELWKAARATSSAQIYFPAFQTRIGNEWHVFWDGGNVANNPAVCAYAEAKVLWPKEEVACLSLGCGAAAVDLEPQKMIHAGCIRNGMATVEMLFAAGSEEVDYQMAQLVGDRYVRVQPELTQSLGIDDASRNGIINLSFAAGRATSNQALPAFARWKAIA